MGGQAWEGGGGAQGAGGGGRGAGGQGRAGALRASIDIDGGVDRCAGDHLRDAGEPLDAMRRRAALRGGHVAPLPHAAVDGARECVVAAAVEARALEAPRSHRHRPPGVAGRVDSHDEAVAVVVIVAVAAVVVVVVLALLRRRRRRFTRRRPPTAPRAAAALAAVVAAEEPRGTVGAHEASVARARRHGHDGRAARTGLVCGGAARGAQQQWVVVLGARGGRVLLWHAAPPVAVEAAREHAAAPQPHLIRVRARIRVRV